VNTITFCIERDKVIGFLKGELVEFYGITLEWSDRIQFTYKVSDVEFENKWSEVKIKLVQRTSGHTGPM
jgi:hypothetical protein